VRSIHYPYRPKREERNTYFVAPAVPWIQMSGKWLERAGFEIDTPLKVRVMQGCIVLTVDGR
jgi:toxic protein SymE